VSSSFQLNQSAPLQKGIQHWHATADKVSNIASGNDQPVVSSSRCNRRVLDTDRKARAAHFIDQRTPTQSNLQRPIKALYPTAHSCKPCFEVRSFPTLRQRINALPNLRQNDRIRNAVEHIRLEPVQRLVRGLRLSWLAEQIGIQQVFHSNARGLISAVVSTSLASLNQPFSGQLSSQSTKSALVSFPIPRCPAVSFLTISIRPADTSALAVDPASAPKSRRTASGRSICPSLVMVSVAVTSQSLPPKVSVRKPTLRLSPTSLRHSA